MRRLFLASVVLTLLAFAASTQAQTGTVVITASGFSNLSATAPANWPSAAVTWPGTQSPNGSKTYTISDADLVTIMTWTAITQASVPKVPTATQILVSWLQAILANTTAQVVQQFFTPAPVPPAPVVIQ